MFRKKTNKSILPTPPYSTFNLGAKQAHEKHLYRKSENQHKKANEAKIPRY